jgi:spermidine/putrescine-binding protein
MSKRSTLFLVLLAAVAVLAGCGGGGGKSSGGGSASSVSGIDVGNCLNDENYSVGPTETSVEGSSPAGINFTLTLYKSNAAAAAVAKKRSPKTTALVENAVIDFRGNPSPYAGAPPAKIGKAELATIRRCIDKSK